MVMDNQSISYVVLGVIVSVATFVAFKAGQVCGLREQIHAHTLDIEILKLEIESALGKLLEETTGNAQLPEGLSLKHFIETTLFPGESIEEQILSLNEIYLDLINHGIYSSYFLEFLNFYFN